MQIPDRSPIYLSGELPSVEAFNSVVRDTGWCTEIRQLDLHAKPVPFSACNARTVTLLRVRFPNRVHQRGDPPAGRVTFGIPSAPQEDLKIGGTPVTSETITCFADGLESVSEPGFSAYTVSLDADVLDASGQRLQPDEDAAFLPETRQIDSGALASIRLGLSSAMELASEGGLEEPTRAALFNNFEAQLPGMISHLWAGAVPSTTRVTPGRRREVIRRTVGSLTAEAMRQCQIEDLCEAGACSQRTLERSFRETFGITPKQYLNRVRLAGVHRALTDAGERRSIGDLAAHWGFWHLSQFAANYRAMYGELPSQTAQSARG